MKLFCVYSSIVRHEQLCASGFYIFERSDEEYGVCGANLQHDATHYGFRMNISTITSPGRSVLPENIVYILAGDPAIF